MSSTSTLPNIAPLSGKIVPIKTVQETQAIEQFGDAYVAEVNLRSASSVAKALDSAFSRHAYRSCQHLRRFAVRNHLPEGLRLQAAVSEGDTPPSAQTIFVVIPPPLPDLDALQSVLAPFAPVRESQKSSETEDVPVPEQIPSQSVGGPVRIFTTQIPLRAPMNAQQAERWSKTLWPVTFNPAAPRAFVAPPPQVLHRAWGSIQPRAGYYLALARQVAGEAERSGLGRGVGAVVVDPELQIETEEDGDDNDDHDRWTQAVIAVAGDGRYSRREGGAASQAEQHPGISPNPTSQTYDPDLEGGPELHALMRAADIVARRRRERDRQYPERPLLSQLESHFLYRPIKRRNPVPEMTRIEPTPENPTQEVQQTQPQSPNPASPTPQIQPPSSSHPDQQHHHHHHHQQQQQQQQLPDLVRPRSQEGYLCTNLDVYLTHEPCLCCSMGMLLSRFRAVIYPRKGRTATGGLASEPVVSPVSEVASHVCQRGDGHGDEHQSESSSGEFGEDRMYYGLHWRKELNWRALGFEFVEDVDGDEVEACGNSAHAGSEEVAFHA